jgi:CBS domain-containing membrane protein
MTEKTAETCRPRIENTDEDLQAALRDMHSYVDISIEDLKALCNLAAQHAEDRMRIAVLVEDIMTTEVVTVSPDADIHEVSKRLSDHRISGLPVVDSDGYVRGIISEADILEMAGIRRSHRITDTIRHLLGEPIDLIRQEKRLEEMMSAPAITIHPRADIRRAAEIMHDRKVKRLPVVDDAGRLIGIVSRGDIVKSMGTR